MHFETRLNWECAANTIGEIPVLDSQSL
jgi:hypothetical protein